MNELTILVKYSADIVEGFDPRHYWLQLGFAGNDRYQLKIMYLKELHLEFDRPLGFHNKNHVTKYLIDFCQVENEPGFFIAKSNKVKFNKVLLALCIRVSLTAWDRWQSADFCGLDFDQEIQDERLKWFPKAEEIKAGDIQLVLDATEVIKII